MVRGSVWGIAFRWTVRGLGFVNTIVLARLLTPADFGIVTIAMLIAGSIELFLQNGQSLALIRHPHPTREHYDSAWTVALMLGLVLGIAIWFAAPLASLYFHEPRAGSVIHIVAFRTMMTGLVNIGVVNLRRDLRFRANFVYYSAPSVVSFVVTIASALYLRNYWALVLGIMSQQVATIVISYVIEPFRPRLSLAKVQEIWSFSIWTLARLVGSYLNEQVDKFAIGGISGAASMGRYEIATDIATIPTAEINAPMINTLFPVMAKLQNEHDKRRELYLQVLAWSALICVSTSLGVVLVANDLVDLALGPKWEDAKPLVPWLSLAFGLLGLSSSVYSAFDVIGRPDISARLQWTRLLGLSVFTFPIAFLFHSVLAVAMTRFAVTLLITPALFYALARALNIHAGDFLRMLWRPVFAGIAMTIVVVALNVVIPFVGALRLLLDAVAGALVYASCVIVLWHLSGRPQGPETTAWQWIARVFNGRSEENRIEVEAMFAAAKIPGHPSTVESAPLSSSEHD